jgi:hypothetical protein
MIIMEPVILETLLAEVCTAVARGGGTRPYGTALQGTIGDKEDLC